MVDRSPALKPTLSRLRQADAGRRKPSVNTPTPVPVRKTGSRPRPLRQHLWRQQGRQRASATGFTLVELLIAVVIIGVLSGVAMPAFLGQQNKAKINAANVQARGLMSYCLTHFIDNGVMPGPGDREYDRLARKPDHQIITWEDLTTDKKCKIKITNNRLTLSQEGIFSIQPSGDATRIKATPAKL